MIKTFKNTILTFTIAGILTISALPVDAALGDTVLKKGMQNNDIQVLQQLLKDNGYFDNNGTTTYYGDITLNAVKNFQAAHGLPQDGVFGPGTYEALNTLNAPKAVENVVEIAPEVKKVDTVGITYIRDLTLDVTGTDVNQLQEGLKKLGYLVIENTTDYFGPQTKEAVIAFQKNYAMNEDGIAGIDTMDMLNDVLAGRREALALPNRSEVNRSLGSDIVATAKKYLGARYVYGGTSPKGFDCSGFTQFVLKQHGISVPRSTVSQATAGTKLNRSELQVGDLLIFSNTYKAGISHAGIYMGNGQFIHASSSRAGGVIISDLDSGHYVSKFTFGRKVF